MKLFKKSLKPVVKQQWLASVAVVCNDKGEILMGKRHEPNESSHDKWNFPGGGIEFGEDPKDAVIREVREEVGVEIELLTETPIIHSALIHDETVHILVFCFPAKYKSGVLDVSKDDGTSDAQWFSREEIKNLYSLSETNAILEKTKKYFQKEI